jgi:polyhydroxyalkanoate synthesis regulator phasin
MDIVTVLVTVLSTVVTVSVAVGSAAYWLGSRLTKMDSRLTEMEARIEKNIERLSERLERLTNAINGVGESIVEYLGLKGVLNQGEVNYLRSEIMRLTSIATNPLTAEEKKRLLELVNKDDLTLEEAEELHNLARKFYEEYIGKTPDAFKVLLYVAAMRGITYRKYGALRKQPNQPPT